MHAALVPSSEPDKKSKGYPNTDLQETCAKKRLQGTVNDMETADCKGVAEGKNGTEGLASPLKQDANILLDNDLVPITYTYELISSGFRHITFQRSLNQPYAF